MPSRADMDRPAIATAALLGAILIGITIPYFAFGGDSGGATYLIGWSQDSHAEGNAAIGPAGTEQEFDVVVRDQRVSNVTIEVDPCADSAQPPLQQNALLTFTLLFENETAMDSDGNPITRNDVSCDNAGPFTYAIGGHPDVGSVDADSAGAALDEAWSGSGNATGTYTVRFEWTRPAGQVPNLPIPVGQPAFTGNVRLIVDSWRATANPEAQEVPR